MLPGSGRPRGAWCEDTAKVGAALFPLPRVGRFGELQFRHRAGGELAVEHREGLLFAPAGQVQRQLLQGRVMPHHHNVSDIPGQFVQALQHRARAERIQLAHHVDTEIAGQAGQDTAHRLHRPAAGGTENSLRSASHGRQLLAHRRRVLSASGRQRTAEIVGRIRPGLGMTQQPQTFHTTPSP